jgi:hypothetical protein
LIQINIGRTEPPPDPSRSDSDDALRDWFTDVEHFSKEWIADLYELLFELDAALGQTPDPGQRPCFRRRW